VHFFFIVGAICFIAIFWQAFFGVDRRGIATPGRHHRCWCLRGALL